MQHVCYDLKTCLPTSPDDYNHILVVVCIFTSYIWLRTIKDKTAPVVATELLSIIRNFGFFNISTSDNGPEFDNEVMDHLSSLIGFDIRHSSAYNPRGNGL